MDARWQDKLTGSNVSLDGRANMVVY